MACVACVTCVTCAPRDVHGSRQASRLSAGDLKERSLTMEGNPEGMLLGLLPTGACRPDEVTARPCWGQGSNQVPGGGGVLAAAGLLPKSGGASLSPQNHLRWIFSANFLEAIPPKPSKNPKCSPFSTTFFPKPFLAQLGCAWMAQISFQRRPSLEVRGPLNLRGGFGTSLSTCLPQTFQHARSSFHEAESRNNAKCSPRQKRQQLSAQLESCSSVVQQMQFQPQ